MRLIGELAFPEVSGKLKATSILCLPLGAVEQHGPHLPLDTDIVVAEGITQALIDRFGEELDLWQLPTLPIGLSREHDWAPGTLSLSIATFAALIKEVAREIVRALPARNLAFINGHGGNRGILENLLRELASELPLNACVIHPLALCGSPSTPQTPDVHGGAGETSLMLALAPDHVRRDLIASAAPLADPNIVAALVFDPGVSFPWRTDDRRLGQMGIIGDPRAASAQQGRAMIETIVQKARGVFAQLLENQAVMQKPAL
jgi:creatinine amidohydrolase/Fe(II)-dependent formamide hydrolase-like protein